MATLAIARENLRHAAPLDLRARLLAALERVELWIERHGQRAALGDLTAEQLKDIGLSRADAVRESDKTFWQA